MRRATVALAALLAALIVAAQAGAARPDLAYNILPPGQYGGIPTNGDSLDQLPLYDSLTPLRGHVTLRDIRRYYKREDFRPEGATRPDPTGRAGLRIVRDAYGVPHIYGKTRADVWFGAGYVTAQDRYLLLTLGRQAARAAVADVPGVNAFGLVTSGRSFVPSPQAEALVTRQRKRIVAAYGAKGRQILRDLQAYADGVSLYLRKSRSPEKPYTINDAIAVTAFIGSIFGNGGGKEADNADFLARLRAQLGAARGARAFSDLMETSDPETPTTTRRPAPYGRSGSRPTAGSPLIDPGSIVVTRDPGTQARRLASNFLLVDAKRSATGEPMAIMGPQLGYYYPEIVLEADLHGPGIHAQGALVPGGGPYVLIGRTRDYAWSLTSASNDNIDTFLERLCEPGGAAATRASRHYVYRGSCRAMRSFDAGTLDGRPVVFPVTVHGPVRGTATVGGRPYAIVAKRSTYDREGLSIAALRDMTMGRGRTVPGFYRSANEFGFTFNWGYVSRKHTAYFSSGRLPKRAPGTNKLLPTLGTGPYDWRGFISQNAHPHDVDPPGGLFLNWNGKPAPGWQQGDDVHSYGSVQRVEMFDDFPRKVRIQDVASIMNRAATEDIRATEVWPVIRAVLATGPAPDARTAQAAALITNWGRHGGSRLDRTLDGKVDDPGAAVMDASWDGLADATLSPVLGPLTNYFAQTIQGRANRGQSTGWYGYVDKDLRTLLRRKVDGKFKLHYCGRGSLAACRASLWAAIQTAANFLAAAQGADPTKWRSDATAERITFAPKLIANTMRWTNRSTFQQVLRFAKR